MLLIKRVDARNEAPAELEAQINDGHGQDGGRKVDVFLGQGALDSRYQQLGKQSHDHSETSVP